MMLSSRKQILKHDHQFNMRILMNDPHYKMEMQNFFMLIVDKAQSHIRNRNGHK